MVSHRRSVRGLTLIEILIATTLVALVFGGAISMYTSALKFLRARQAIDVTTAPDIAFEPLTRKIAVANSVSLGQGNSQLNLRVDEACSGVPNVGSAGNIADDSWWHFRLQSSELWAFCDNAAGTVLANAGNPAGITTLTSNLDTGGGGSTFGLISPSGVGAATVVAIHIVSTSPIMTVDTETALGASAKR